jgi:hypothetical protein
MKSLLLTGLASETVAREALRAHLPGQENPWLVASVSGDPIAYFSVEVTLDGEPNIHVQADISGRHHSSAAAVVREVLHELQSSIGGVVEDDA